MSKIIGGQEDNEIRVKITDRRKFDSHGKRREDVTPDGEPLPADEPPSGTTSQPEAQAASKEPGPAQHAPDGMAEQAGAAHPPAPAEPDRTGGQQAPAAGQVDFQSFVYFLYMSALHELGIPTTEGGEPRPADLERARFFVEVLRLLEVKTKGNLEPGETKLLEEALYNLRMQYVGIAQKPAD